MSTMKLTLQLTRLRSWRCDRLGSMTFMTSAAESSASRGRRRARGTCSWLARRPVCVSSRSTRSPSGPVSSTPARQDGQWLTDNTLIRVAVGALLGRADELDGNTE
jgi:hypothetical protein